MRAPLAIGLSIAALIALPVGCSFYTAYTSAVTAPGRVVARTLTTSNILQNYELFHDENETFKARVAQIAEHRADLKGETDRAERQRLRIEMEAQQQSCRELVADYNANSLKQNRALFKDRGLPPSLDAEACETQA